jgi:hypothetical protein
VANKNKAETYKMQTKTYKMQTKTYNMQTRSAIRANALSKVKQLNMF